MSEVEPHSQAEVTMLASRILQLLNPRLKDAVPRSPATLQPQGSYNGLQPGSRSRLAAAKSWQRVQRLRGKHLDGSLFADPAWDILLEVYISRHEQRMATVSNVALATAAPASTALRWLASLVEDGWLVKRDDDKDHRRVLVLMTDEAFAKMDALIDEVMESDRKLGLARMQLLE